MSSLSHKTAALDRIRRTLWIPSLCLLWMTATGLAQEATTPDKQGEETDIQSADQDDSAGQEPIPVPIQGSEETKGSEAIVSRGLQTFNDDIFHNVNNRFGFSLNINEAYSTNVPTTGQTQQSSSFQSYLPRVFLNLGKKKSKLHVDVGAGYRQYNEAATFSSWDYFGNAQYSYEFSKNFTFDVSNQFTSSYADSYSFISQYSPLQYNLYTSNELLFNDERINRDSLYAELSYLIGKRIRLGVFSHYELFGYSQNTLQSSNALEVGGTFSFKVTKWLSFNSSISSYLESPNGSDSNARINHVQLGGFSFSLSKGWKVSAGGGIDVAQYQDSTQLGENINSGISYLSRNILFTGTYQRQFTSAIGIPGLFMSDIFGVALGHRMTRRISARVDAYYYRSSQQSTGGMLKTFSGGGGLSFALLRALVANLTAAYQNQQAQNFSVPGLGLNFNCFVVSAGLQYMWPSLKFTGD